MDRSSMPKHALEEQLTALTREFVGRLIEVIRNASFAEVASLPGPDAPVSRPRLPRTLPAAAASPAAKGVRRAGSDRQTAARRAEMGERILAALEATRSPLGVRALAGELGVAPDLLAQPLRELRGAGKIRKHGEKRATTYSLA